MQQSLGISLLVVALLLPTVWSWYLSWGLLVLAPVAEGRTRRLCIGVVAVATILGAASNKHIALAMYHATFGSDVFVVLGIAAVVVIGYLILFPQRRLLNGTAPGSLPLAGRAGHRRRESCAGSGPLPGRGAARRSIHLPRLAVISGKRSIPRPGTRVDVQTVIYRRTHRVVARTPPAHGQMERPARRRPDRHRRSQDPRCAVVVPRPRAQRENRGRVDRGGRGPDRRPQDPQLPSRAGLPGSLAGPRGKDGAAAGNGRRPPIPRGRRPSCLSSEGPTSGRGRPPRHPTSQRRHGHGPGRRSLTGPGREPGTSKNTTSHPRKGNACWARRH